MMCLGIEGTAHTFGVGIFDGEKILSNVKDAYVPKKGSGIHPAEAAEHHRNVAKRVFDEALEKAGMTIKEVDYIAYSKGPGLPPCLKAVADFVKILPEKGIIEVNHPVAHIEIAKFITGAKDPVVIYVSGGNTQIIAYAAGRYRVFGETGDIPIGNAIDVFIREADGRQPGGPVLEDLAELSEKNYIELPYVVKGMDLSFSGIVTAALSKYKKDKKQLNNLCFSFQETCYAMLTEVTERAMAHTGKTELLLTGGVAASKRLREMLSIMAQERGGRAFFCPLEYCGDNGTMIGVAGYLAAKSGQKPVKKSQVDFNSKWRVDEVEVLWV
ncbi:MAG: tRNA (adenosine(37)-N6)-threonylcarbamoyltransferase complex transferase subunit TsaD [Candidatus Aenigmarchaeota archaeon]|nr:tRNA (adenosine(37)-N6)-threonylcarbamoyltransferase complex transferase subunit TsaD [Candidatus Aenigmarchaeota archaeon]